MAAEDRDQIFEKALGQHLRAANAIGKMDANPLDVPGACPDAETLAAYHERSLSAEQTAISKQHILACEHCQAILEQLVASDEVPLSVANAAEKTQTTTARGIHILKPRGVHIWRWIAPAGAIAAAVLVWVSIRENSSVRKLQVNEIAQTAAPAPVAPQFQTVPEQIAKAKPPSTAPLTAQLAPAPPRSDAAFSRLRDKQNASKDAFDASTFSPESKVVLSPKPTSVPRARQETLQQDLKAEEAQLSRDIATMEKEQKLDGGTDSLNQVTRAEPSREQAAGIGGALSRSATAESAAAARGAARKKSAAAPQPAAEAAAAAPGAPALQQQEMDGMSRFKEAPSMVLTNATAVSVIAAPGGSASWRIGRNGYVAHSTDNGKTWTPQASGVNADLVAGAAVSDKICWVVGRGGTVLLTTDGGGHWQKLTAPTRDDLLSITAVDAGHATVTAGVGSYQTTDGGAHWRKLAAE